MKKKGEAKKLFLSLFITTILCLSLISISYAASSGADSSSDSFLSSIWNSIVSFFRGITGFAAAGESYGSVCGNTIIESGEQCDDGNTANGDCCDSGCQWEPNTQICNEEWKCSDSALGDNAYDSSDYKMIAQGYCDGQGNCDYTLGGFGCDLAEGTTGTESSGTTICVDDQFDCVDTCNDTIDNDGDGDIDVADSDCPCVPSTEICDGIDNDCDGQIDATGGITLNRPCYTGSSDTRGVGKCQDGHEICFLGQWGSGTGSTPNTEGCVNEVLPTIEQCDDYDWDCDGEINDVEPRDCWTGHGIWVRNTGECSDGLEYCGSDGLWGTLPGFEGCVGEKEAIPEQCDTYDWDCDDEINDVTPRYCYTGLDGTEGVGRCNRGSEYCGEDGQWGTLVGYEGCYGEETPIPEECNLADDDCDGTWEDENELTKPSSNSAYGLCQGNIDHCDAGSWLPYLSNYIPEIESCNGLDDDCDGSTDETFTNLGQSCTVGVGECEATGVYVCNSSGSGTECNAEEGEPTAEICDNKDNDCDGNIDDTGGITLNRPCYNGASDTREVGLCSDGSEICFLGNWGSGTGSSPSTEGCQGEILPSDEVCDAYDRDCDGEINDVDPRDCWTGEGQWQRNEGVCDDGLESCGSDGQWDGNCQDEITPASEACDSFDWDCNGAVHTSGSNDYILRQDCYSGLPETENVGLCRSGLEFCGTDGEWGTLSGFEGCQGETLPSTEQCNNYDDDCDGDIDDEMSQPAPNINGLCENNMWHCAFGDWIPDDTNYVPVAEVCDNLDNDCDGSTDEGVCDLDGDGIAKTVPGENDNSIDTDGDLLPDGPFDVFGPRSETTSLPDTDGDGIYDFLDTDSDNDGIPDLIEGNDGNSDGIADIVPSGIDTDGDGLDDVADPDQGATPPTPSDTDSDGIPNWRDTDSDNDGIDDSVETVVDSDNDGVSNYVDLDSDNDGVSDEEEGTDDSDGDGIPNYLDNDNDEDGDGVLDVDDKCSGTTIWYSSDGLRPNHYDSSNMDLTTTYGCSCDQILYCKPGNNNGEYKWGCTEGTMNVWTDQIGWSPDCQANGIVAMEGESKDFFEDTDNAGTSDPFDLDNDNDGILDGDDSEPESAPDEAGQQGKGKPDWWCDKHPGRC